MEDTKKIALLLDSLAGGGAERVMLNLANKYAEQGYKVDLVLAQKRGEYLDDVDERIRIVDLAASRFWEYFKPMVQYFKNEQPDVMLSATTILNLLAIITRKLSFSNARLVVSEHIDITSFAERGALQKPTIVKRLIKYLYPYADQVVAVSEGAAQSLSNFSGLPVAKVKAIYNGVVDQHKLDLASAGLTHEWFGSQQLEAPVIVAVGRLQPQKDFPMLINAFAKLRQKMPARLIILGEGELRDELQKQAQDLGVDEDLSLHGFEDNPFKFLANANVFALSSLYEGLPTVLIEAMACGCPVVSTKCPSGPEEILENGKYGTLVDVSDEQAFADALYGVLSQQKEFPDQTVELKQQLITHAQNFNVDKAFSAYSKVLGLHPSQDGVS